MVNPKQCGGRPCIRGMRIRVSDILDLFAAELSFEEILAEMPDLEIDDLKAALVYASGKISSCIGSMTTIWIDAQISPAIAIWIKNTFNIEAFSLRNLGLRDAEDLEIFTVYSFLS